MPRLTLPALVLVMALLAGCTETLATPDDLLAFVESSAPAVDTIQVILVLGGAVLLAAGYKLHRYVIALPGFAIGGSLGALLAGYMSDNRLVLLVAVVLLGGAAAWLALSLFRLAAFVSGALGGIVLVDALWSGFATGEPTLGAILLAAVIGGTLFLGLMGLWMPVLSSAIGAGMVGSGLGLEFRWMVVLFGLGLLVQFGVGKFLGENAFRQRYPRRR